MLNVPSAFVFVVVALLLATGVALSGFPGRSRLFFSSFFALLAGLGAVLGLRYGYGLTLLERVQPMFALSISPTLYLGFAALAENEPVSMRRLLSAHFLPICLIFLLILLAPEQVVPVDAAVFASLGLYFILLVRLMQAGPDRFVHVPAVHTRMASIGLSTAIAILGFVFFLDAAVFAAEVFFAGRFAATLVDVGTLTLTLALFAATVAGSIYLLKSGNRDRSQKPEAPGPEDREILKEIDLLLSRNKVFMDSSLSLARMARRLRRPARAVSNAINRCTGKNFSRYINEYRLGYAQQRLENSDQPITEIMLDAGFVTKSNFNVEFSRFVGMTPSAYRKAHQNLQR